MAFLRKSFELLEPLPTMPWRDMSRSCRQMSYPVLSKIVMHHAKHCQYTAVGSVFTNVNFSTFLCGYVSLHMAI